MARITIANGILATYSKSTDYRYPMKVSKILYFRE